MLEDVTMDNDKNLINNQPNNSSNNINTTSGIQNSETKEKTKRRIVPTILN